MNQLLRISIWLAILITPTLFWFHFTSEGQGAWQHFFIEKSNIKTTFTKKLPNQTNKIKLIPAYSTTTLTKPRLKISITSRDTIKFPFSVYVVDDKNKKMGINNSTLLEDQQIKYSKLNYSNNNLTIDIHPATSKKYTLNISGNPGGNFRLAVGGVSPEMESSTTMMEGNVPNNRTLHYNINLTQLRSIGFGTQMKQSTASRFISQPTLTVTHHKQISLKDTCLNFYKKMEEVPDGYVEVSPENECDFTFHGSSRNNSFISPADLFYPYDNSLAAADGWTPSMEADGPDGSYFQITNGSTKCQVSGSWDGGLDDDPSYIPSNKYSISISCHEITVGDP